MHGEHCSTGKCLKFLKGGVALEPIFQYFKYEELHENSTKFEITSRHVYWDQDNSFDEKTEVKKSRWTVPLIHIHSSSAMPKL